MKLKTLIVTVVVLGVLSLAAYWLTRPPAPPAADPRVGTAIVDRAAIEQAAKLRLTDAGKTVLLVRQPDATWRVASYHDFPADFSKLSQFVGELTGAKLQRLVTTKPDRIARLDFKDTSIALLDANDHPLWSLTLGKNADSGGGRYVRFGDESKAYLASFNAWLDPEAKNWADAALVPVKTDDIAQVELTFPDAPPVRVHRAKKDDAFAADSPPDGQKLKTEKITSLLSTLTGLRFSDTTAPDDPNALAAKAHSRLAKLTTFDGKTLTIELGRKPEEKKLKAPPAEKSGPASIGTSADLAPATKSETSAGEQPAAPADTKPAKVEPEFETIPVGPVFAFVSSSDSAAPINELMKRRAFQIYEYAYTGLPAHPADLFEPVPAKPAEPVKSPEGTKPAEATTPAPSAP